MCECEQTELIVWTQVSPSITCFSNPLISSHVSFSNSSLALVLCLVFCLLDSFPRVRQMICVKLHQQQTGQFESVLYTGCCTVSAARREWGNLYLWTLTSSPRPQLSPAESFAPPTSSPALDLNKFCAAHWVANFFSNNWPAAVVVVWVRLDSDNWWNLLLLIQSRPCTSKSNHLFITRKTKIKTSPQAKCHKISLLWQEIFYDWITFCG